MDPLNPDSPREFAVGVGTGFGAEAHLQATNTKVFTFGEMWEGAKNVVNTVGSWFQ